MSTFFSDLEEEKAIKYLRSVYGDRWMHEGDRHFELVPGSKQDTTGRSREKAGHRYRRPRSD